MLEIKCFKQAKLNFLFNVKSNNYNFSSFGKKMHFGSDIPPFLPPFFCLVGVAKPKTKKPYTCFENTFDR